MEVGYSVQYQSVGHKKYPIKAKGRLDKRVIICAIGVLFAFILCISNVRQFAAKLLMPGDPDITQAALSHLVEDIREGERITDAFTDFCSFIIDNA